METKMLSSFTSKYALALYEALRCGSIFAAERGNRHSDAAALAGRRAGKLERYPDLNRKAIRPAVNEVNALSPYSG